MNTTPLETTTTPAPTTSNFANNKSYTAGFWRRLIAFIVDLILTGFFCYILSSILGSWVYQFPLIMSVIGYLLVITYFGVFNSKINQGQSFGKMLMSIHVVNQNQQYISLPTSFLRAAILYAPFCLMSWTVSPYISLSLFSSVILVSLLFAQIYLFIFNRANRRCVHDFISHTCVNYENTTEQDIRPTWSMHFYIAAVVACFTSGIYIYELITEDKSYIPNGLKTFNFKGDQQFDFGYAQYPLENGQTLTENHYLVTTQDPKRLNNPFYAEELAHYFRSKEPELFKFDQHNFVILTAKYQFGLIAFKETAHYYIQNENNQFQAIEQHQNKSFILGGGF